MDKQNTTLVSYANYFRKNGLRLLSQVSQAPIHAASQLGLPLDSAYHYLDYVGSTLGPDPQDLLYSAYKKPIFVKHVTQYDNAVPLKGQPRQVPATVDASIRKYHTQNKRMRLARDTTLLLNDQSTLLVYSYSLLPNAYKYIKNIFSSYNKWYNEFATALSQANELTKVSNKQQFFILDVPGVIPPVSKLDLASANLDAQALKTFNTPALFYMLHIWAYFSQTHRAQSVFSLIPDSKTHLINVILKDGNYWTVLNLGVLNSFLKYEQSNVLVHQSKIKLEPAQLQRRLLKMYMTILEGRTNDVKEVLNDEPSEIQEPSTKNNGLIDVTAEGSEEEIQKALQEEDEALAQDLSSLEATRSDGQEDSKPIELKVYKDENPDEAIVKHLDHLSDVGAITSIKQYNAFKELASSYKGIKLSNGKTVEQAMVIDPAVLQLDNTKTTTQNDITIIDESMKYSIVNEFDKKYVESVMQAHILKSVIAVQSAGICVTNIDVEKDDSILGESNNYAISLTPLQGKSSTLHFKLPVVASDGTYIANGNKYRMIKQIGDVPIRKIAPDKVSLTTYYSKVFVCRGTRVATDYGVWLCNAVTANAVDKDNKLIESYMSGSNEVLNSPMPRAYTALMTKFNSITAKGFTIYFNEEELNKNIPTELVQTYAKEGRFVIGQNKAKHLLLIDQYASLYIVDKQRINEAGTLEEFLGANISTAPVEYIDVGIFGKDISVGFILAYYYGFNALIKALGAKYRTVQSGQRINMLEDEYTVVFKDQTYVFQRDDKVASLILAGFRLYHKAIKLYDSYSFDTKSVYGSVLSIYGLSIRYIRELEQMEDMFVDPISKEVLIKMKEPTDFKSLLIRSAELLSTDKAPRELMLAGQMRIKGYERFAGVVYQELVKAIRAHNAMPAKSTKGISMKPHAVWTAIAQDGAKQMISDINPIEDLRGAEALTLAGTGGRSKRSMVKRTRAYDFSHMGIISEATKDSSDVGINTYLSANPGIKDLYGFTTDTPDFSKPATMISTSALLAPGSDVDDAKRVGFVSIQNAHSMPCKGYITTTVRTGMESVVADRTSEAFACNAKKAGKVIELSESAIVVEYEDKTVQGFKLGTYYGPAAGLTIPHEITTFMKLNQKFAVGDTICYNDGFFAKDWANPTRVTIKSYALAFVAMPEFEGTVEDSSVISEKIAGDLITRTTKIKSIVVRFDQTVTNLLSVGTHVKYDTVLCYVQDQSTSDNKLFDESTIEQLKVLGAHSPKAKVEGMIEKIEVFYHGDTQDMSESILKLASASDSKLKMQARRQRKPEYTGSVDAGYRAKGVGEALALDTAEIKIYISTNVDTGVGDKGVFGNQLKTTFAGRYKDGDYKTQDEQNIDAIFGAKSGEDRIVQSLYKIGTANTLLKLLTKAAIKAYEA